MKCLLAPCLLLGVLFGHSVGIVRADISPEQVRQSIERGVQYLKLQQADNGTWRDWVGQPGGVTSLCTLALLNSGVEADDADVQRALKHLRSHRFETTYAVSLQTMALCKSGTKLDLPKIALNVQWLEAKQIREGPRKGAWSYPRANGDNSNSQFALLALHAAERAGVQVNARTWRWAKAYWEDCKNPDGSWGYYKGLGGTGSMTCAGIAAMIITTDKVQQSDAEVAGDEIRCCRRAEADNRIIENGLQWLGKRFSVTGNPGSRGKTWLLYYLYGVERVGRLTARRFIGGHDWYREGADHLVRNQVPLSGNWVGVGHAEDDPIIATSLALLFLAKGRRPVLLSKLKHGNDWNAHRNDVHNLTRFVESRWKMDLTWQTVDLQAATVEDLLQAPVLYLCGKADPRPARQDQQKRLAGKLRDYLDRGGFLLAEGYCNGAEFDEGFRALMKQVFREPEYRLQLLEPEHPIWRAEMRVPPGQERPLWGIEFGCRTSVVYAPPEVAGRFRPSLSCLWELARSGREQKFTPAVRAQVDGGLAIGINILAYATNRELRGKEDSFRAMVDSQQGGPPRRGRTVVAKLRHPGGCDAAPRALLNLLEAAGRELNMRAGAREEPLAITDPALFDHHLVFMHGRTRFRLTERERQQLQSYLERGGSLFADSICASKAFTDSFRREMALIFPQSKLEPIPAGDPLLTPFYGGYDLKTITRRDPQSRGESGPLKATLRRVPPELEGIRFGDRWGVIFSRYDLSCALEKHDSLECRGYTREDASRIGLNVLLYSLQR